MGLRMSSGADPPATGRRVSRRPLDALADQRHCEYEQQHRADDGVVLLEPFPPAAEDRRRPVAYGNVYGNEREHGTRAKQDVDDQDIDPWPVGILARAIDRALATDIARFFGSRPITGRRSRPPWRL